MAKCSQCGKDVSIFERDIATGACPECQKIGARPASLGCGTLILIAIVVAIVTESIRRDVSASYREITVLQTVVERLENTNAQQLEEIRALRESLESCVGGRTAQ